MKSMNRIENSFFASIRLYDKSQLKQTVLHEIGDADVSTVSVKAGEAEWAVNVVFKDVTDRPGCKDVVANFNLIRGQANECSVGIELKLPEWSRDNYVVMPSALYAGNRFESRCLDYPPLLNDAKDIGVNVETIITDVPRLNITEGPSRVQLLTRDLATPAEGIYFPNYHKGLWLLTDQETVVGDSGMFIEESADRRTCMVSLTAPGVREDIRYCGNKMNMPSEDRGANFTAGDRLTLRLRYYAFDCADIPALFDLFVAIRSDLSGPVTLNSHLPFSAAWAIQEDKYNRQNWNEYGFYNVGVSSADNPVVYNQWQLGWVGGMMVTHPLLFEGNNQSKERALKNFEFFFNKTQAESGFFYGMSDGVKLYSDGYFQPHAKNWHLIRKSSDALYFVLKQFLLLEKQNCGNVIHEKWILGVRKLCDAFVRLWEKYGQFGQFIDIETGDIVVGGSTSASTAPAGLALAGRYLGEPKYLEVATASAKAYSQKFVLAGVTTGGPGEASQCPDSESAFGLLESFIVLYEVTGDKSWIAMAEDMANQCASWCVSYDFKFPSSSLFGKSDMKTAGSVWANVQNKHSAPGICTLSGDSLFKLFRATGKKVYLEMIRQTAHNLVQYLSRSDRPIGKMPAGWMTERVNLSDWAEGVGEIFVGSCWCEVSNMLSYVELPGLYIQPDTGLICAIDHIEASLIEDDGKKLVIRLANATDFDADVKLCVENSGEASKVLGQNYLLGCRRISVPAQSKRLVTLNKATRNLE